MTSKKRSKSNLKFILLILGILILSLFISYKQQNVLGVMIAQGKQLQIDWFLPPNLRTSPTQSPSSQNSTPASQSPTSSNQPTIATPLPPASQNPSLPRCNYDNNLGEPADPNDRFNPNCSCPGWLVTCSNRQCVNIQPGNSGVPPQTCQSQNPSYWCSGQPWTDGADGVFCIAKPVIYLYPKEKTVVDVKVTMEAGNVVVSDPLYDEIFQGWDNVTAYPDGSLDYRGHKYHELFYETTARDIEAPNTGIIIPISQLKSRLLELTSQLGLIKPEQDEFLEYWLPELEALNSPYIQFSLINEAWKERIDKVIFSPEPDTFIYILAYFKPLNQLVEIEPLILPMEPPKRVGFTAVEWGGTIERN